MVTLEFILIEGVNDTPDQAARLRDIASGLHATSISSLTTPSTGCVETPQPRHQQEFLAVLQDAGCP